MPNDPYMLLWLEGPFQSWGHDSKFGRRDSLDFPTRSGVLGLICCARGAGDAQVNWLQQWDSLDMQVMSYVHANNEGTRQPLMQDLQMIGADYDTKDPWENGFIPKTSDGKKAVGGGTKMTHRYYVQDMAFAVAMQVPASFAEDVASALQYPTWDLSLGRKNCVPTELIYQGLFENSADALAKASTLSANKNLQPYAFIRQGQFDDGEILVLNDVPLAFGPQKKYRERYVTVQLAASL